MDYQVVWSPKALDDIDSIASFISMDSPSYAASVVKKILDISYSISRLPYSGRIVPEFVDVNIREKFAYSYRVIYRIKDKIITIAAVIHGKRLLDIQNP
jgi:toxin ParE1/3/4